MILYYYVASKLKVLDFEQLFTATVISQVVCIRGHGRDWGKWWGIVGSRRWVIPCIRAQAAVLCL